MRRTAAVVRGRVRVSGLFSHLLLFPFRMGVFRIRPLVGVRSCRSSVGSSLVNLLSKKTNGTYEEMPMAA